MNPKALKAERAAKKILHEQMLAKPKLTEAEEQTLQHLALSIARDRIHGEKR